MSKPKKRHISGIFLLNKPDGITSNAALQKVRWLFNAEKAGHTGALDPIATGLLPICLGEATKFSHYLLAANKTYQARIELGKTTTTGDKEGEMIDHFTIPALNPLMLQLILHSFIGDQLQIPPMYSALKKDGKRLYKLAREGVIVEREPRPIHIESITLLSFTDTTIDIEVTCSKGTYIRVLAEDIATALGTGGHITMLHRIATGNYQLIPEYTIEYLESLLEAERDALLLPTYALVSHLPRIQFTQDEDTFFCCGNAVNVNAEAGIALAFKGDTFLGLGEVSDKNRFYPKRVINY